jgi:hypothetical protein
MKTSATSRLLAVFLLSIPAAWFYSSIARLNLNEITANPAGYLQHARSLQHPDYWYQLIMIFVLFGAIVFFVEGLAQVFGRWLPEKKPDNEASRVGTTFD